MHLYISMLDNSTEDEAKKVGHALCLMAQFYELAKSASFTVLPMDSESSKPPQSWRGEWHVYVRNTYEGGN